MGKSFSIYFWRQEIFQFVFRHALHKKIQTCYPWLVEIIKNWTPPPKIQKNWSLKLEKIKVYYTRINSNNFCMQSASSMPHYLGLCIDFHFETWSFPPQYWMRVTIRHKCQIFEILISMIKEYSLSVPQNTNESRLQRHNKWEWSFIIYIKNQLCIPPLGIETQYFLHFLEGVNSLLGHTSYHFYLRRTLVFPIFTSLWNSIFNWLSCSQNHTLFFVDLFFWNTIIIFAWIKDLLQGGRYFRIVVIFLLIFMFIF